jgi:hypothetical protein
MKCTAKNPWKCTVRVCTCGFFAAPDGEQTPRASISIIAALDPFRTALERGLRTAEEAYVQERMNADDLERLRALSLPTERGR